MFAPQLYTVTPELQSNLPGLQDAQENSPIYTFFFLLGNPVFVT